MNTNKITFIYTTVDLESTGKELVKKLLAEKIIGCGVVSAAHSCYHWNGTIQTDDEWIVIMKTVKHLQEAAMNRITALHPYDLPCILISEMEANRTYYDWLLLRVNPD